MLRAVDLSAPDQPARDLLRATAPDRLGRPSIDGDRVVLHVAARKASSIAEIFLPTGRVTVLRSETDGPLLLNPSELDGSLLYVRSAVRSQKLLLGPRRGRSAKADKLLYETVPTSRRDAGHERDRKRESQGYPDGRPRELPPRSREGVTVTLWTTALAARSAYVTRIRETKRGVSTQILKVRRR